MTLETSAPSHFLFSHLSMGKDWTESTESTPSHWERRTLSINSRLLLWSCSEKKHANDVPGLGFNL